MERKLRRVKKYIFNMDINFISDIKNTLNNIKDDDLIKIDGKTYKLTHSILIEKLEKSEIYVELLKLQIKELLCNKDTNDEL